MRTRLYVEGHEIDIDPSTNVPINLQVVDVKDLNKRVGEYTKTVTVYGTKNNNKILGNAFNLQIDFDNNSLSNVRQNFNPKRKARAVIESHNIAFSEGYIQLRDIRKTNGQIQYDVVYYGRLSDIITEISGKDIIDLDMSDLNHTISEQYIIDSWTDGKDYFYPLVDYGHENIRAHGQVNIGHLKPAIKLKRYIDQIFEESGFEYDAPFFETTEFNNLYIPYNGVDSNTLTEDEIEDLSSVSTDTEPNGSDHRFDPTGNDFANREIVQYELKDDVLQTGHLNTALVLPAEVLYQFQAPETRVYDLEFSGLISFDMMYQGTNDPQAGDPFDVRSHQFRFFYEIFDSDGNEVTGNRQREHYERIIIDLDGDELAHDTTSLTAGTFNIAGVDDRRATFSRNMIDRTTVKEYEYTLRFSRIELQEGDRVKVNYDFYADWEDSGKAFFEDGDDEDPDVRITRANTTRTWSTDPNEDSALAWVRVEPDSFLEVEPVSGQLSNTSISYEDFVLQEVEQKDLLLSTLKLFNLVAVPDPTNPRNIIIRERDDFFDDGDVLDWTNKIDISREQRIQPVRDPDVDRWVYSFKEGKDFYSNQYRDLTDREYGDIKVNNNSEFGKDDKSNIDIIFEPTPIAKYEDGRVFNLVLTFPSPSNKGKVVIENTSDIRELTGEGQDITIVIEGMSYHRVIRRVEGSDTLYLSDPISQAERDVTYGCVIHNRYDRLSIPSYKGKDDNVGQDPVETNPKLLYYSGTKSCNSYILTSISNEIGISEYPILHHLNAHPEDNPTFDYNFGRPQRVFFEVNNYPTENIYTRHHEQTQQEILDGSNILTVYVNLSNTDIVNLEYNNKIHIDGQQYRINKVIDYNLNKNQPAKIELIKL